MVTKTKGASPQGAFLHLYRSEGPFISSHVMHSSRDVDAKIHGLIQGEKVFYKQASPPGFETDSVQVGISGRQTGQTLKKYLSNEQKLPSRISIPNKPCRGSWQ